MALVDGEALESMFECPDSASCPTLEAVLRQDECVRVQSGCGLIQVRAPFGPGAGQYWYDSFGSPPVGRYRDSLIASRDLTCDKVEVSCLSCAREGQATCARAPVPWPPQESRVPESCACELDEAGAARTTLECFCATHDCPDLSALIDECTTGSTSLGTPFTLSVTRGCGLVWFSRNTNTGTRYGFDPSGTLVAAQSHTPGGPVSAPCNTFAVFAGRTTNCEASLRDDDGLAESGMTAQCQCPAASPLQAEPEDQSCPSQGWFEPLL